MTMRRVLMPVLSLALACPALAEHKPTTEPTSKATTTFPTPAELIKKMKAREAEDAKMPKVAYFDLTDPVLERGAEFNLFGGAQRGYTLHELLGAVRKAKDDANIKALLVTVRSGVISLAQAQELRDALLTLKDAGKPVYVYADEYDTTAYTVATGASDICLLGGGGIMIPGVGLEATFAKGLLDKVGVTADYVQIGEYKGAQEPFTRTEPTAELRGELTRLVDAMYAQIVDGIATHRNLSPDKVKAMIDKSLITATEAKEQHFVDHLVDADGLRDLLKGVLKDDPNVLADYGKPKAEMPDFSNPFAIFTMMAKRPEVSDKPAVALIHAEGAIVDGAAEQGLFGGRNSVGSDDMREALRTAVRDGKIKAVVIRIDSPGGSALASEAMWQAVRRVAAKKPVVVSIGGMAASGGYYLASAGDVIYADPTAIVGSIGVVGGKFVTRDLFDKLGITSEPFRKGENADLFASDHKFTDGQRAQVTAWMKQTYDQFVDRILTTRKGKIVDIDKVARGRIFLAAQAKDLGMVDALGGVEAALVDAAGRAKLKPGEYEVRPVPGPKTLTDYFTGGGESQVESKLAGVSFEAAFLGALPRDVRDAVTQQLSMLSMLQSRPVVLASPVVVRFR
jgi:protease-4